MSSLLAGFPSIWPQQGKRNLIHNVCDVYKESKRLRVRNCCYYCVAACMAVMSFQRSICETPNRSSVTHFEWVKWTSEGR